MEARWSWGRRADAGVEPRRNRGIVGGVDPRTELGDFDSHRRREVVEPLVRPHVSRWSTLDRSKAAPERRVDSPLRLVGPSGRRRIQRGHRVPRQHVETRHGLREWLNPKKRAGRRASGNVAATYRAGAADEWIQPADRRQEARTGKETQFQEITS